MNTPAISADAGWVSLADPQQAPAIASTSEQPAQSLEQGTIPTDTRTVGDGLDDEDDDDESGDEPSEARQKRRDKRRRYRRRKRDRDLQEELLVRMQHSHLSDGAPTPPPAAKPVSEREDIGQRAQKADGKFLPYGHGQGQGVGHNPHREDSCLWHYCPAHYDTSRPLYVRVCGLKAAIHIDQGGTIWLNLSQLMKLVGKTKKQTLSLYGEEAFDPSMRGDVKLLDLKDGPKASAYVSEHRARQLVIPFMGPTKSTNFLAELDRIHREFRVPPLAAYDDSASSVLDGGPAHVPLYMRFGLDKTDPAPDTDEADGHWDGDGVGGALADLDFGEQGASAAMLFGVPMDGGREEAGSEASGPGPPEERTA